MPNFSRRQKNNSVSTSELARLGLSARELGLPVFFALEGDPKSINETDSKITLFSYHDLEAIRTESPGKPPNHVYLFFPTEEKVYHLGSARDYSSREHPLMGYVATFNELAMSAEAEEIAVPSECAGVGFLAFEHGIGVQANLKVAARFLNLIHPEERRETFSRLLVQSLLQGQYSTALSCIPYSEGIHSYDEEGRGALVHATRPGAKNVHRRLIADTTPQDLSRLRELKEYALFGIALTLRRFLKITHARSATPSEEIRTPHSSSEVDTCKRVEDMFLRITKECTRCSVGTGCVSQRPTIIDAGAATVASTRSRGRPKRSAWPLPG